jgi:hypothetical protein
MNRHASETTHSSPQLLNGLALSISNDTFTQGNFPECRGERNPALIKATANPHDLSNPKFPRAAVQMWCLVEAAMSHRGISNVSWRILFFNRGGSNRIEP